LLVLFFIVIIMRVLAHAMMAHNLALFRTTYVRLLVNTSSAKYTKLLVLNVSCQYSIYSLHFTPPPPRFSEFFGQRSRILTILHTVAIVCPGCKISFNYL